MQIRINLHTQRGGRSRGRLALPSPGAALSRLLAPARDRFLVGAVVAVAAACGAVTLLHTSQRQAAAAVAEQEAQALRDSTRFATAIAARSQALALRDSVVRQLRVIAAIDSTRYVWAHVLDEVSRALPPYTWLTNVQQTSAPPAPPAPAPAKGVKGVRPNTTPKAAADTVDGPVRFRVVGQTVDIQALTLFMRDLETSAFVRSVQLVHSQPLQSGTVAGAREVTEFTLDAEFERPAREALRTVSIAVPVR